MTTERDTNINRQIENIHDERDGTNGEVISAGNAGVRMKWDDGQEGVIHHDDMDCVSRRETQ